jgi:ABC-type branched-subunit amino acid transport system permease subunit
VQPGPTIFGIKLGLQASGSQAPVVFGALSLAIVCLVGLMVARLRNSPTGRSMIAVRSNERAAAAAGIDVAQTKLFAFGLSAWIAGMGGALFAYQVGQVSPDSFATFMSLGLLATVYVAGVGRIAGAAVAGVMLSGTGVFVTFLDLKFHVGQYQMFVAGLALTITAIKQPNGIAASPPPPLLALLRRIEAGLTVLAPRAMGTPAAVAAGAGAAAPASDGSPTTSDGPGSPGGSDDDGGNGSGVAAREASGAPGGG